MRFAPASSAVLLAGVTALATTRAHADVTVSAQAPGKVEAGAPFRFQLQARADDGEQIGNPDIKLPPDINAVGPSIGQQSQVSIINGHMSQSIVSTATWTLMASKPGTYRIGPASVQTATGRKAAAAVSVVVVPSGALPTPPLGGQPQPFDPFSMLRGMGGPGFPGFPGFPDLDEAPQQPQLPELPEEFRLPRALDPLAFLRARAQPRKVVVGEQVTLSIYAYAGRGNFQPGVATEPSRNDFLAFNLMEDVRSLSGYQFDLDGQRWLTTKISEFALFPLKSGKLKAGAMSFNFIGRSYTKDPHGLKRESQPIEVDVVEPPLDGRPPGYRLGDVGRYTLSAQVEPREVPAGGSISVVAKLEGTGNVPFSLLVPERTGVHFLEPQLVEQVAPQRGVVQGFRTFTYVVELSEPGEQDLGEISLPFWDPKAKAYGVARAALGQVKVTGVAKAPAAATSAAAGPQLKGLVSAPATLGAAAPRTSSYWPSRPAYWALLFGLPLTAALGFALSDLLKVLKQRLATRKGSLASALDEALAQVTAAVTSGNTAAGASAAERALFLGIEKSTGLKARGVLKRDLPAALERAGVDGEVAAKTAVLLDRCDELRLFGQPSELPVFATEVRETCQKFAERRRVAELPS